MRVITGTARGRRLETLEGEATRPTADRVKEALFSMLQFELEGRQVLDLFAGSGQLGIEALSRGAAGCVFVDSSPEAAGIIKRNLQATRLFSQAHVLCRDALDFCAHTRDRFDLVLMDPPYAAADDLLPRLLPLTAAFARPGGTMVCETGADTRLPESVGEAALWRVKAYGRTRLWIYRR